MKFWFIVMALLISSPSVKGEEMPFKLPGHWMFDKIPGNQGMEYFHGFWRSEVDVTITPSRYKYELPDDFADYKILFEAPNYVLVLKRRFSRKGKPFTYFGVLTYRSRYSEDWAPNPTRPHVFEHTCSFFKGMRREGTFELPRQQLIKIFKNSHCKSEMNPVYDGGTLGEHWSKSHVLYKE